MGDINLQNNLEISRIKLRRLVVDGNRYWATLDFKVLPRDGFHFLARFPNTGTNQNSFLRYDNELVFNIRIGSTQNRKFEIMSYSL